MRFLQSLRRKNKKSDSVSFLHNIRKRRSSAALQNAKRPTCISSAVLWSAESGRENQPLKLSGRSGASIPPLVATGLWANHRDMKTAPKSTGHWPVATTLVKRLQKKISKPP